MKSSNDYTKQYQLKILQNNLAEKFKTLESLCVIKNVFFEGNGHIVLYDFSPYLDKYKRLCEQLSEIEKTAISEGWEVLMYSRPFDGQITVILMKPEAKLHLKNASIHAFNPNARIAQVLGIES